MSSPFTTDIDGDVAVVTIDNPPVNASSQAVRAGLMDAIGQVAAADGVKAVVLLGAGRTFVAGADIKEFGKPPKPPMLTEAITGIEQSDIPWIAAIHGTALGGGFEIALGCHYRIALPSARVGLPEVKLGILPGAGGTQRTPRLIGARKALEMITKGDHVPAAEALDLGLIDDVIEADSPRAAGLTFARKVIDEAMPARRVRDLEDKIAPDRGNDALFADFAKSLEKKARGLFSPFRIVECVQAAVELPFDEGMARERELFVQCMDSPQRAGLIHAFFAERAASKVEGLPADVKPAEVEFAGVIGSGTMGGGIAMCFADAGSPLSLIHI